MLLSQALESRVVLDEEHMAFLTDNGDTVTTNQASQELTTTNIFQTNDLDAFDSDCEEATSAKTKNEVVQDTTSSSQQDAMIMSMIKEMSNQVAKCNEVNKENKTVNESLTAELESHKTLSTTVDVLKKESKAKEDKYLDEIIDFEKKKKDLDNNVYKLGQSTQTMHMLTKPQVFYDESYKTALGYQSPLYLTNAQRKQPLLYCGHTIVRKHDTLFVIDIEETLKLVEESKLKMLAKQNDPIAKEKKVNIAPIDYAALNKLSGHFIKSILRLRRRNFFIENDRLLEHIICQDVMCIAMHADLENKCVVPTNDNHLEYAKMEQSYIDGYSKVLELEAELSKKKDM
ncbi:hypothetical protein Tco_1269436 [Tanacetum coccineum]